MEHTIIAKTFKGLEEVLAKEVIALGGNNVEIGNRMVSFTGDKELLYKANFFTSHFGEIFRGYNPNDPANLGGFDKRAFRNNVLFAKELTQHGPLQLS